MKVKYPGYCQVVFFHVNRSLHSGHEEMGYQVPKHTPALSMAVHGLVNAPVQVKYIGEDIQTTHDGIVLESK